MKKLTLLSILFTLFLVNCSDPPLTVREIEQTQVAQATAFAVTQEAEELGALDTVRAVAPEGAVVADEPPGRAHDAELRISYGDLPPDGGTHNPTWQRCGIYENPVRPENALHSMEHGAVWLVYQENLSAAEIDTLEDAANSVQSVLMNPYPNLRSPVVVTAWGVQLEVDSADDPRIQEFIDAYARGPQTPEPSANCFSGVTTMDEQ